MNKEKSQYKAGAVISYSTIAFSILSGLLYTPWMLRCIGNDQYAIYVLATSIASVFMMDFGINSALSKYLSKYYASGDIRSANVFLTNIIKIYLVISAVIFVVLSCIYMSLGAIYGNLDQNTLGMLRVTYIIVGFYSIVSFSLTPLTSILVANELFIPLKSTILAQKAVTVLMTVAVLLSGAKLYGLVIVNALCGILASAAQLAIIQRKTGARIIRNLKIDFMIIKRLIAFSVWVAISSMTQNCICNISPSILGMCLSTSQVTFFSLAVTLERYVYSFATAITGMFIPRITKIYEEHDDPMPVGRFMTKIGRYEVYLVGLMITVFICIGNEFVTLWMGNGYGSVYPCAVVLMLSLLIIAPMQVGSQILIVKDMVKQQSFVDIVSTAVGIALMLFAPRLYGEIGGCAAFLFSYGIQGFGTLYIIHKKLGIDCKAFVANVYARWMAPCGITVLSGLLLRAVYGNVGWIHFCIKGAMISILYTALIYFMAMSKEERTTVGYFIRRNIRFGARSLKSYE